MHKHQGADRGQGGHGEDACRWVEQFLTAQFYNRTGVGEDDTKKKVDILHHPGIQGKIANIPIERSKHAHRGLHEMPSESRGNGSTLD